MNCIEIYRKSVSVLITVVIMASCKVSKDTITPDTGLPGNFRDALPETENIGRIPWISFFPDPGLQVLISNAIAHNYDLQNALKDIEAANLVFMQAKLGNLPGLDIQATGITNRPSDNSLNGFTLNQFLSKNHIEDYTVAASLSWEADLWGKIKSRKAAALATYLQTAEARKLIQTKIVNDIAKGYYNLLMLDAQLAIAQRNVLLNDSTLAIIQLQYDAGQVTSLAIQQALAQKLVAESFIPLFEQQIAIQENAISILSGVLPGKLERQNILGNVIIEEKMAAGVPVDLLGHRPDVRQAEFLLQEANANVGYAKANMYPSLTITAQGGFNSFTASNWVNMPASLFGAVGGSLTQPLFQKKKLKSQFEIAKVRREQAVIEFRQRVLTAVGEVSDNLVKIEKLAEQRSHIAARVNALEQATINARMLFGNGLATYLEVIIAQANVLQSELDLASIKKAQLDAKVDLYRSAGGGWK